MIVAARAMIRLVFEGLDEIDWSGLEHAYGPATDVPEMLFDLLADDPQVREEALDWFYGAVHHQGSVYDSTAAVVPFLVELVLTTRFPDRAAVITMLASICGFDRGEVIVWGDDDPDTYGNHRNIEAARHAVGRSLPELTRLLDDSDPRVRKEVPALLVTCPEAWPRTLEQLMLQDVREPDTEIRSAIIDAVTAAAAHLTERQPILAWLEAHSTSDSDPVVRLRALAALISLEPAAIGAEAVIAAIRDVYGDHAEPVAPAPKAEPTITATTLIGAVRQLHEQADAGVRLPWLRQLLHRIDAQFGSNTAERTRILLWLMAFPDWNLRNTACNLAAGLATQWRGDHAELAAALGPLLFDPEPRVRETALAALLQFGPLAAPAAEWLRRAMATTSDPDAEAAALRALVVIDDPHALAVTRELLDRDAPPAFVLDLLRDVRAVEPLLPLLIRHLPGGAPAVAKAVGRLGPRAAQAVPALIEALHNTAYPGPALAALGNIGPAAAPAVAIIRTFAGHSDNSTRFAALTADWRISADPNPPLAAISSTLDSTDVYRQHDALELAALLGPAAGGMRRKIEPLLDLEDDPGAWARAHAADALWHITAQVEPSLTRFLEAAAANKNTLHLAIPCFAAMGPAAHAAIPVLEDICNSRQRCSVGVGFPEGDAVTRDRAIIARCRDALSKITGSVSP